ncbi:UDP-galactopyranose mutase [Mycoplasma marinum]|uniref:UDP-galactopyranose mutase n=1 Tax=Mycoplasma marinum TaxID=1937190 RepID=A0A4R0XLX2_9MOLU|nr:UDP-galactopyranose mutase [Mycoplasma marinum]TCG11494.1 UDP-galactopyranose mutase [Mycoplasma marinum]
MKKITKINKNANYDIIIVGAGFAGSIMAWKYINKGKKVLIIDKRDSIAGNAFDYKKNDNFIHKFGPHIFRTNDEEIWNFINKFGDWEEYKHIVYAKSSNNSLIHFPLNYESIKNIFPDSYENKIQQINLAFKNQDEIKLMEFYKKESTKDIANKLFNEVIKPYSAKAWGTPIEKLDPSTFDRVPFRKTWEKGYFNNKHQVLPKDGYTKFFEKILESENIDILLNANANSMINKESYSFDFSPNSTIIWTGPIDELANFKFGELKYRSLKIKISNKSIVQGIGGYPTLNLPHHPSVTRESNFKYLNFIEGSSDVFLTEEPGWYSKESEDFNERYYPISTNDEIKKYDLYKKYFNEQHPGKIKFIGRLAEYKYYDMEQIIKRVLNEKI